MTSDCFLRQRNEFVTLLFAIKLIFSRQISLLIFSAGQICCEIEHIISIFDSFKFSILHNIIITQSLNITSSSPTNAPTETINTNGSSYLQNELTVILTMSSFLSLLQSSLRSVKCIKDFFFCFSCNTLHIWSWFNY